MVTRWLIASVVWGVVGWLLVGYLWLLAPLYQQVSVLTQVLQKQQAPQKHSPVQVDPEVK